MQFPEKGRRQRFVEGAASELVEPHATIRPMLEPMDRQPPGRPSPDETADYYHRYIDRVPDGDIRQILFEQRGEILSFLQAIPEMRTGHRYAPDKWSVVEVLCHINDCERLFVMRAFWFARGLTSPLPSFEPEIVLKNARAADRPWSGHIQEFGSTRASTVDFFRSLPAGAWDRRGIASDNPFSVRSLAYIAAGHVIHHVGILRERYLATP